MISRMVAIVLAALLGGGVLAGCTRPAAEPPAGSTGTATSPATTNVIFLMGQVEATAAAARLITGFETRINATPGARDVVLFAVTAVDGPMPQTREQIEALRGKPYGPAAILLVKTDQQDDPELRALVVQEMRDLLSVNQVPRALELPVIIGEEPNLNLTLRGLVAQRG